MMTILFDLDGTLLDTQEDLQRSVNFTLREMQMPEITQQQTRAFVGGGITKLLERALPKNEKQRLPEALALFLPHYQVHMNDHTAPYPGVLQLLADCRAKGWKTAVVSNKDDAPVQALCAQFFLGLLDFSIGRRDGLPPKPAPDSCYAALAALGASTQATVYVGDSEVDIATAKAADLPLIAVSWGFRDAEVLRQNGAAQIVENCAELWALLYEWAE